MLTLFQGIETVINNRPLIFVYNEPCVEALTPNHLVFGRKLNLNGVNSNDNIEHEVNKSIISKHEVDTIISKHEVDTIISKQYLNVL